MIINTNLQTPEKETIEYIRNIVDYFTEAHEEQKLDDSLVFSFTQSEKSKPKKKKKKPKYVSPYNQKDISIKNITKSKKKTPQNLNVFASINIKQLKPKQSTPQSCKKSSVSQRYIQTPSLFEKIAQRQIDKLKQEACQLYKIQLNQKKYKECQLCKMQLKLKKQKVCQLCKIKKNQKEELSDSQRKAKWADFLLRQRKWEENRQSKLIQAKHQAISQQQKLHFHNFVPKQMAPPNLEQNIKKIKRQKLKLEERLRQLQPNYLTWRKHNSPSRKKSKDIKTQRPEVSNQKRIYLSNQKEIHFLLKR